MALETITGSLLAYKELEPGTFQHADQLTTERRTNHELRRRLFHTADGPLYTAQKRKVFLGITREPQNLFLQDIDAACRQSTDQGHYFPDAEKAQSSFEHRDTIVVDVEGLSLIQTYDEYGSFVVNPRKIRDLNSQQRIVTQRIYGPDDDSFAENMEMCIRTGIYPRVFVLMSSRVRRILVENGKPFLGLSSWLNTDGGGFSFGAGGRHNFDDYRLRGERRVVAVGDANEVSPAPTES